MLKKKINLLAAEDAKVEVNVSETQTNLGFQMFSEGENSLESEKKARKPP